MSPNQPLRILFVDDVSSDADLAATELRRAKVEFTYTRVDTREGFAGALTSFSPDIVISDYSMPEFSGMEALELALAHDRELPFVVLTGSVNEDIAVSCLKAGAWDYVLKDHRGRLPFAVREALALQRARANHLRAEEELRRNEAKYQDLFYNAPTLLASIDPKDGTIVECSRAFIERTGFGTPEVIAKPARERYHPDCRTEADAFFERTRVLGETKNVRLDLLSVLGGKIPVLASMSSVRDADGRTLNYRSVWQDISDLVRAEEDIRQREMRFRAVADSAVDAIITIDEAGIIIGWNPGATRAFGHAESEILGHTLKSLIPERFRSRHTNGIMRLSQGGEPHLVGRTTEMVGVRKDGTEFPLELSLASWETSDGRFYTGIIRDITIRKNAEAQLQLESSALSAAANAIVITDRDGIIEWTNPAFSVLTGYSAEESLGKNPRELVRSGVHERLFYAQLWETVLAGNIWHGEMVNRRKDGTHYHEEQTITPVRDERGNIAHFIAIKQDVTQRRRSAEAQIALEAQLRQAQKLDSLGTLASGIAHDFNNILGIILAHTSLLEGPPVEPALIQKNTAAITRAVTRGSELVKQMLTFARKSEVLIESIAINDAIKDVVKLLNETLPKSITVDLQLENGLSLIEADSTQLHQVLINLCLNARDAMPGGGLITISSRQERGEAVQKDAPHPIALGYIVLSVADTGTGIDEDTRLRIFEPFFTTKERGKGTGLGLSLVFGIMESHKGFVTVRSTPGAGSAFHCYFPVPSMAMQLIQGTNPPVAEAYGGEETILFVEDEESLREPIKDLLTSKGYTVLMAGDGEEAFTLFRRHADGIHLIVSDLDLPKISGDALFRKVRQMNDRVPFILASGFFEPGLKMQMLKEGVRDLLQKPYNSAEVVGSIRKALDQG